MINQAERAQEVCCWGMASCRPLALRSLDKPFVSSHASTAPATSFQPLSMVIEWPRPRYIVRMLSYLRNSVWLSGPTGAMGAYPASRKSSIHGAQLVACSQSPWMKTTGVGLI